MKLNSLIAAYDRIKLSFLPTPLEYAERLTRELGGPRIYFKRDDCTGLAFGGNKVRKLEFVLADAVNRKADVIVTIGGLQSNWARQTAAAARRLGIDTVLILDGKAPEQYQGNLLLDHILGCDIRFREISREEEDAEISGKTPITGTVVDELRGQGRTPYVASLGAANPLGNLGYVNAMDELNTQLKDQGIEAKYLVLGIGTGGTQAGLEIGARLLDMDLAVIGMSASRHTREKSEELAELCNETAEFLDLDDMQFTPGDFTVTYDYIGEGYAIPTKECIEAIRLVAQTEGVILDPVYTGKAMAGLIDWIEKRRFDKDDGVIFLHTGGATANFEYGDYFRR